MPDDDGFSDPNNPDENTDGGANASNNSIERILKNIESNTRDTAKAVFDGRAEQNAHAQKTAEDTRKNEANRLLKEDFQKREEILKKKVVDGTINVKDLEAAPADQVPDMLAAAFIDGINPFVRDLAREEMFDKDTLNNDGSLKEKGRLKTKFVDSFDASIVEMLQKHRSDALEAIKEKFVSDMEGKTVDEIDAALNEPKYSRGVLRHSPEFKAEMRQAAIDANNAASEDVSDGVETNENKVDVAETLKQALAAKSKLQSMMALLDKIPPEYPKLYSAEEKKELEKSLKGEYDRLATDIADLEILAAWENGAMSPAKFAYVASERWFAEQSTDTDYYKAEKRAKTQALNAFVGSTQNATQADVDAGGLPDITDDARWSTYDQTLKQRVRDRMGDIIPVKAKIASINERVSTLHTILEKNKNITELEKVLGQIRKAQLEDNLITPSAGISPFALWSQLNNKLGIQWFSINDVIAIFKSVKDAIDEVKKEKEQLRRARGASYVGKLVSKIPGMEGVEQILDANNEKKNNDAKRAYMDYLNSPQVSIDFNGMFDPQTGLLHKEKNDTNRTMAILEVAAQKGMLYDINGYESLDQAKILNRWPLRDYLPQEWNENQRGKYFETLQYMTLQGRKKQMEAADPMPIYTNPPEKSVVMIKNLLKGRDLWFARGYMAKVISKGKRGEMSALVANAVLEAMQKDEWLRSVTPEAWFDSVGGLGAGNVSFSLGFMKWQRKSLVKWTEENRGVENPSLDGVNDYTTMRERVKNHILSENPNILSEEGIEGLTALEIAVAKVMASQSVKLKNGKVVSIFSPKYASFSYNNGPQKQKDVNLKDSDMDFFEERSEAMMSDPVVVNLILHVNTTGHFTDPDRAAFFIANVVKTVTELDDYAKKAPGQSVELTQAAAYFRSNMGHKIKNWLEGEMRGGKTTVATERLKDGKYALLALFNAKVLTVDFVKKYVQEKGDSALAMALLKQCANDPESTVKDEAKKTLKEIDESKPDKKKKKAA